MKKTIKTWSDYDKTGKWCLRIEKTKGRLTLDEIRDACTEYEQDFYLLVIKAMDEDISQYYLTDDLDGDFVTLYRQMIFSSGWRND